MIKPNLEIDKQEGVKVTKKADGNRNDTTWNRDEDKTNILNAATQSTGFYIDQKEKLLKSYGETADLVRDFVESIYGAEFADTL